MEITVGISLLIAAWVGTLSYAGLRFVSSFDAAPGSAYLHERRARLKKTFEWLLHTLQPPPPIHKRWTTDSYQNRLAQAGVALSMAEYATLRWMSLVLGLGLGSGLMVRQGLSPLAAFFALLIGAGGIFGPELWLARRLERERLNVDLALPDFLDHLRLALEAGLGFEIALQRTSASMEGRLGDELKLSVRQLLRGQTKRAVLTSLGRRTPSIDLRAFATAVSQAERLGTSLVDSLLIQARLLRSRRRRRAQEASRRLPVLVVFPLVFFFLPALLIIYLAPPLLQLLLFE